MIPPRCGRCQIRVRGVRSGRGVPAPESTCHAPYRLVETHFDEVKGQWEERFEGRYGFWRGFVDEQVRRYLDCGLYENGIAVTDCVPPPCFAAKSHGDSATPSA